MTGVQISGKPRAQIVTWRCSRCGFLEQYAEREPDTSEEKAATKQAVTIVAVSLAIVLFLLAAVLLLR